MFYLFVGKVPKFFNFSDGMKKSYLVEFNINYFEKTCFMAHRKFY